LDIILKNISSTRRGRRSNFGHINFRACHSNDLKKFSFCWYCRYERYLRCTSYERINRRC